MATRIDPERMRLFKEFSILFIDALTKYPIVRDGGVQGVVVVGGDGVMLRIDRDLPYGGYVYVDEFLSFEEHPAWTCLDSREAFAVYIARELIESLLMETD